MRTAVMFQSRTLAFAAWVIALGTLQYEARATATSINVPVPPATVSACVPPGTSSSGHLQMMIRFTLNGDLLDPRLHVGTEINSAGTKIVVLIDGEPVEFVSNESHMDEANISPPPAGGASEWTIHDSFRYTSPGRRENYRLTVKIHMTLNANGELTSEVEECHIDCYVVEADCCGG